ncbi:MAG: hypothetical protein LBT74_02535 [Acidobacteriota bacterium]|jgi:hypothetical protein|nr:hypothetical protein [Acidobacteriota bacterium]
MAIEDIFGYGGGDSFFDTNGYLAYVNPTDIEEATPESATPVVQSTETTGADGKTFLCEFRFDWTEIILAVAVAVAVGYAIGKK